jgi:hypothetical protein
MNSQINLNLIRLYLKANTLSEITEPKGNRICASAFNGQRDDQEMTTQWPRQIVSTPHQVRR